MTRRQRERIEALVGHLLSLLDATDGDPDLEDSHDAEDDLSDREPDDDDERSAQPLVMPGGTRPVALH